MSDVLVIDDERDIGELVKDIVEDELDYRVDYVLSVSRAISFLKTHTPKIIILDIWLEGSEMDGIGLLKIIADRYKDIPVIVITGHGNISTALKAVKLGAYDFIEKPFSSKKICYSIKKSIENARLKQSHYQYRCSVDSFIGESKEIKKIRKHLISGVNSDSRALIYGEVGVGKEKLARLMHNYSHFAEAPFFKVNIFSFKEDELMDFFFNHGSLSLFEKARGGTIYFNEISLFSPKVQSELLSYFNSSIHKSSQYKILSSSRVDLKAMVSKGLFNFDLYQRLVFNEIKIPPLRCRKGDIKLLFQFFLKSFINNNNLHNISVDEAVYTKLIEYNWPSNVLELKLFSENLFVKFLNSSQNCIKINDLNNFQNSDLGHNFLYINNFKDAKKEFEKYYISLQMQQFNKNISKVAKFLGVNRSALHKKIQELSINI